MFFKNNCYIYLEARDGISYREDFQIIGTPETFNLKGKFFVLGFIFSNDAGLYLRSLLRKKDFLRHIFKTL